MITTPYGHKVYAMAAEYPSAAALYEAAKRVRDAGFRRWDVYSPFPIHGMDGAMGIGKSWLSALGSVWRNFGIPYRGARRIWPVIVSVPARCARETYKLFHRSSVFPDHVRADGAFRRIFGVFCVANHESLAALEPSDVQLGTFQPRDQ